MDKTKGKLALEKATRVADSYYSQARKALREGDYHNAIQYAKLAISYNEAKAEYYVLLADCQVRNPGARWQHLAEQNLTHWSSPRIGIVPFALGLAWAGLFTWHVANVLLQRIREHLLTLPDETRVLPGHGPMTSIGHERATNPFVGEGASM